MTEAEWQVCTDPQKMLAYLRGKASDRKLRLFACAYARQLWPQLDPVPLDERSKHGVEVAERYADGVAHERDREEAWRGAEGVVADAVAHNDFEWASVVVLPKYCLAQSKDQVMEPFVDYHHHPWRPVDVLLVKDIFGNPFRAVAVDPAVLAWNGDTIPRLAQAAYEQRALPSGELDPARLAVLADALEDVGCTSRDILDHLRSPGPHYRGCFALDLLLGKEP